ncbi:Retrovirus-related Pol polyprotein from transposon TNT 1-94 [Dendrobium catenatum]|uniref:Retrovirus-related Pol polyprotein from transposon TNT 1-94 n=1 Tax=Dendrobium catenatum TaxID=906689 RepID=A0A2I0XBT6_9ASPA|nr:Retrovirus-related Pol polyprotein from transposon TNT 1-94 [Dendrobium catenatum]
MANSASSQADDLSATSADINGISSSLKFLVSNLKHLIPTQLSHDNFAIWKSQLIKLFKANGFSHFLDSSIVPPATHLPPQNGTSRPNPAYNQWSLTDQNLAAAICSTISTSILPYVLNLESTSQIWQALETRFQSSNRSRVIQLKNELHNISMKNSTMTQYLSNIKTIVDQISAAGAVLDTEDILLYILNGLPPSYQSFKTSIRTMLTPISLDNLYSLLLSEEINLAMDASRLSNNNNPNMALYSSRGRGARSRGRSTYPILQPTRNIGNGAANNTGNETTRIPRNNAVTCQICLKKGHSAQDCWHRSNLQYIPQQRNPPNRALAATTEQATNEWYLDSGASSHITNSLDRLSLSSQYQGSDAVTVGDGRT